MATAQRIVFEVLQLFTLPIVTQLAPAPTYYPAEAYHQNYYNNHPFQGYCAGVVGPKVAKFRKTMQEYLKT
jgi:peptide-methionine (S)-S-oxide reductase